MAEPVCGVVPGGGVRLMGWGLSSGASELLTAGEETVFCLSATGESCGFGVETAARGAEPDS